MTTEFRKKALEDIKAYARQRRAERLREKYHPKPKPAAQPAAAETAPESDELDLLIEGEG